MGVIDQLQRCRDERNEAVLDNKRLRDEIERLRERVNELDGIIARTKGKLLMRASFNSFEEQIMNLLCGSMDPLVAPAPCYCGAAGNHPFDGSHSGVPQPREPEEAVAPAPNPEPATVPGRDQACVAKYQEATD